MAQIGTPSAGWYTDPSGQHRARYWDGASWTEQVRDDLTDPVGSPTDGGAIGGHPAADTVAGVAEAVAAVAANDVFSPEPGFVVDYGNDGPWGTLPGSGPAEVPFTGGPADPFAPVGPTGFDATPAAPAALVGATPGGMPASPAPPAAFPPMAPTAEPVPASVPVPAAAPAPMVTTGPAPGWYPDPAARHQGRLWDGTRWTERVVDNGVEGYDPLPGAPAVTTVDPTVGAWSSELVVAAGPDGSPLSAGQISLASLPETADLEPTTVKSQVRPTVKVRIAGGFVLAGAIALLAGSTMSWMEVTGPKVGDEWTATGLDLGDGRITVVLAVVLAVLGAMIITGRGRRIGGTKVAAMGSLVAGAAALAVTAVDIADVADRATRLGVPAGAVSNVGTGLWVAFIGALFAVGGGLMAFANRQ